LSGTTPDEPSPDHIELISRTRSEMLLTWKLPRCNGHIILNYELQLQQMDIIRAVNSPDMAKSNSSPWRTISNSIVVEFGQFQVSPLLYGVPYRFRLRARNALGWGNFSEPSIAFWTHGISF